MKMIDAHWIRGKLIDELCERILIETYRPLLAMEVSLKSSLYWDMNVSLMDSLPKLSR